MRPTFLAMLMAFTADPAPPPPDVQPTPPLPAAAAGVPETETNHDLAYRIGKDIRCPVCQGMSIAESPSTMAQDMMGRVRAMLKEGKGGEDIRAYFVQRYGVWVLLDPPKEGFVLFVWLVPPVVLVGAGWLALRHMRRLRQTRAAVAPADASPASPPEGDAVARASADPYLQAIRDEVQR